VLILQHRNDHNTYFKNNKVVSLTNLNVKLQILANNIQIDTGNLVQHNNTRKNKLITYKKKK